MEKFHYQPKGTTKQADEIVLPWAQDALSAGFIRRNRKGVDQEELGWMMLEEVADEKTLEKVDRLSLAEFAEFMTKWQGAGDTDLGES